MSWLLLAGSVAGVLGLAWLSRLLGLGGAAIGGDSQALRIAEDEVAGFAAREAFVSSDGKAALVRGDDGSFVLLKVHGANIASRRLSPPVTAVAVGEGVTLVTGERMFGDVRLLLSAEDRDRLRAMVQGPDPLPAMAVTERNDQGAQSPRTAQPCPGDMATLVMVQGKEQGGSDA